jgi:hypothetical protein
VIIRARKFASSEDWRGILSRLDWSATVPVALSRFDWSATVPVALSRFDWSATVPVALSRFALIASEDACAPVNTSD